MGTAVARKQFCDICSQVVAWSLADLAGRGSPGPDDVAAALSFRESGVRR